ncbi:bifunctional folylpolyglutamate synthase/dihydrofolate synthase [Ghiorsea bivora]|uniref:bifunctional folylpolyglutamate synthase/dihydrofolate synthase n=1 Tax=Ghiorsea bivora TaxID=1485545 RepID=UPI00069095EF|nr:Mur ligase family protein [Ghiorsea bivora]
MTQDKPRSVEAWLEALGLPSADRNYLPGHERVQMLLDAAKKEGLPFQRPLLRIRVAGTNGKGSTAHFLAQGLQTCGYKVGLYTSPHIQQFHERMRIQGISISNAQLTHLMAKIMPLALDVGASYFETATVLALSHFSMQQVDVEILEAGVGAKLDATTAVPADVGVLTPIALDHQDWLGDDLISIAQDKAYVFQGCTLKVSAPQTSEVKQVLSNLDCNIIEAKPLVEPLAMLGMHQQENAGVAWQVLQQLQCNHHAFISLDLNGCLQVLKQTNIAGRLQVCTYLQHTFWLDAAHNSHAIQSLLPTLASLGYIFDAIILCTRQDRDLSDCVPKLKPFTHKMVVMTGHGKHTYTSLEDALQAETKAITSGRFLVLGSFVTLGSVLQWMEQHEL